MKSHNYFQIQLSEPGNYGIGVWFKSDSKDSETVWVHDFRPGMPSRNMARSEAESLYRSLRGKGWYISKRIDPTLPIRCMNADDAASSQGLGRIVYGKHW